jgi:ribosomal protein S4E
MSVDIVSSKCHAIETIAVAEFKKDANRISTNGRWNISPHETFFAPRPEIGRHRMCACANG